MDFDLRTPPPNHAPDLSEAVATTDLLWPPNHGMVAVGILGVTDPEGDPVVVRITAVFQDEPANGLGDGDTGPDAILDGEWVNLRAERSGRGNGRVYHVTFTADDGQGGISEGSVTVCVPHRRGGTCVDDGPLYDSTQP